MGDIAFKIEGEHAEELTASLLIFIKQAWDIEASTKPITPKKTKADDKDWGVVLAIIGIAISLPGFLESDMVSKVTQRIEAKKRLEQLFAWQKEQPAEQKASIYLVVNNQEIKLALEQLTEILDALQADGFGVDE